jgi:hypothetical protein
VKPDEFRKYGVSLTLPSGRVIKASPETVENVCKLKSVVDIEDFFLDNEFDMEISNCQILAIQLVECSSNA